jgi:hypothetical protein
MDLLVADNTILEPLEQAFARDFAPDREAGCSVTFLVPLMRTLDKAMRARTVRCALFETFPQARRIEAAHIDAIVDAVDCEAFTRDLGYDLRATLKCDTLKVVKLGGEDG